MLSIFKNLRLENLFFLQLQILCVLGICGNGAIKIFHRKRLTHLYEQLLNSYNTLPGSVSILLNRIYHIHYK
jgi:hypothetical protein